MLLFVLVARVMVLMVGSVEGHGAVVCFSGEGHGCVGY